MSEQRPDHLPAPPLPRVLGEWVVILLAAILAIFLIAVFAHYGTIVFLLTTIPVGLLLWTALAREAWWILLPGFLYLGGVFYFGFKIYTYEFALLLCWLPLIPIVAVQKTSSLGRSPLPKSIHVLLVYFILHLLASWYLCKLDGLSGVGSLIRVYVRGIWPLVFALAFHSFGSTRPLRTALMVMYVAALFRSILGTIGFFAPGIWYVPIINFILPGGYTAGLELRESAVALGFVGLCYYTLASSKPAKLFHVVVLLFATIGILLGGGRASLAIFGSVPLTWAIMTRQRLGLVLILCAALGILIAVNLNPDWLYVFPPRVQRTLSITVVGQPHHDVHQYALGSDEWHFQLARHAVRNWLKTPISALFGSRIYPFNEDFLSESASFEFKMEVAASMGYYESGLWTILASLGVVGGLLYVQIFTHLLRPIAPVLLREGIRDHAHAFYFLAVGGTIVWLVFSWIAGHFPSHELMLALIARAAYDDRLNGQEENSIRKKRSDTSTGERG
ncbi:MAG: hypothetical protein ACUVWX_03855 [Kiritimatiellia bacterium]